METLVRRIIPCPSYDPEAMESWLSDLAAEGLLLGQDGIYLGSAYFRKEAPQRAAYRLVGAWQAPTALNAVLPLTGVGQAMVPRPQPEALDLNELYGWEYVAKWGRFFIYRASSPLARELDTDPQVQFYTIQALSQWAGLDLVRGALPGLVLAFLVVGVRLGISLGELFAGAPLFTATFCLLLLLGLGRTLACRLHTGALARKLRRGLPLDHGKDWKAHAPKHYAYLGVTLGSAGLFLLSAIGAQVGLCL